MVTFNPQIPIGQTFQSLLNQSSGLPYGDGQRVPFEFSSTIRNALALDDSDRATAGTADIVSEANRISGTGIDELAKSIETFAPGTIKGPIRTLLNPKSVKFEQPKRINRKDVRNGTVFFHFTDDRGQNNDILKLAISGSSGNVDLRADKFPIPATQDVAARRKLEIFQQLYLLTREPVLFRPGIINEFSIRYTTKIFPGGITFYGFYDKVMDFEETAEKPNSVNYSLSFTVQRTQPDLNDIVSTTNRILQEQSEPNPAPDSTLFAGSSGGRIV